MTPPLLRLQGIDKSFGGIAALRGVSLDVPRGAIAGIIGPNGAGKTTLFNIVTGAYRCDAGRLIFDGRDLTGVAPYRIARAGIVRTFQNIRLFASMSVLEHLLVAARDTHVDLRRFLPFGRSGRGLSARIDEMLALFDLASLRDRPAKSLSYGQQRRLEMARAMMARPSLLLLDEPVAGMNGAEADEIRRLMLRLRDGGLTILLIEHDMKFVMGLCDTLYVLDFGVPIAHGRPDAIRADPAVLDAYLGVDA